jgi:hypothetical protein
LDLKQHIHPTLLCIKNFRQKKKVSLLDYIELLKEVGGYLRDTNGSQIFEDSLNEGIIDEIESILKEISQNAPPIIILILLYSFKKDL